MSAQRITVQSEAAFSRRQVPVLETPQGPVTESSAIARYLATLSTKQPLYPQPSDPADTTRASIDAWVDWATSLDRITQHWVQPMFSTGSHKPSAIESAQKDFEKALQVLEAHLSSRTYLVGEGLTLADIVVVSHLLLLFISVSLHACFTCRCQCTSERMSQACTHACHMCIGLQAS